MFLPSPSPARDTVTSVCRTETAGISEYPDRLLDKLYGACIMDSQRVASACGRIKLFPCSVRCIF